MLQTAFESRSLPEPIQWGRTQHSQEDLRCRTFVPHAEDLLKYRVLPQE